VTISDSNIKVWDLEFDECIKNMNEHTSPIVEITQNSVGKLSKVGTEKGRILSISSNFEAKVW
jgi:WD40 repeat protein